ncbi:hypothetical protein GCM10007417_08500 [Glycocaulis alkaliphilus]|nr:hypothetical protein GCM10007417_08500 [Glycocaulis alkaliphilus]
MMMSSHLTWVSLMLACALAWSVSAMLTAALAGMPSVRKISAPAALLSLLLVVTAIFWLTAPMAPVLFAAAAGAGAVSATTDLRRQLLPDAGSVLIGVAGLASAMASSLLPDRAMAAVLTLAVLALAAGLVRWRTGRRALGSGDLLLGAACATWVPASLIPLALLLAVAITLLLAAFIRHTTSETEARLPFGPGLMFGYGVMAIAGGHG